MEFETYLGCDVEDQAQQDGCLTDRHGMVDAEAKLYYSGCKNEQEGIHVYCEDDL